MNIQDLPSEILEKILVEGNFLSVSRVCQTWRDHAERKKSQFNEVFFDLTKDDLEKIEKEKPDQLFIFNSPTIDKNGCGLFPKEELYEFFDLKIYYEYISDIIKKIFKKIISLNALNIIYDPLIYVKSEYPIYILSKKLFTNNEDQKISGLLNPYFFGFNTYLLKLKNRIKIVNIEIKDVSDRIENIDQNVFLNYEIEDIYGIFLYYTFRLFEKFTFNAPNNTYIIYDKYKKLLIIRFGHYGKYNFPKDKISICQLCSKERIFCSTINHKQYIINSFRNSNVFIYKYYPAGLINLDFEKIIENIEKLIIISSEFYEFMFDQLLEISKKQKEKKIKYYCLEPSKTETKQKNFKFKIIEKEKEQKYSFKQMHFKFFGQNI